MASDARAQALAIADNRVGELDLSWDPAMLQALQADGVALDGFWTDQEFAELLGERARTGLTDENAVIEPAATTIARGDLLLLDSHRVLCGDATDAADVATLLDRHTPFLLVSDPPYGVDYDPMWRHRVDPRQRTVAGRVANDTRVDWREAFAHFRGDVAYVWHAGLHAGTVASALVSTGFTIRSQIVWVKQSLVMSRSDYQWRHEPAWYAVRTGRRSRWCGDRRQSTVWEVPNLNPFGGRQDGENPRSPHATQKPVRLWELPIVHHTKPKDAIFDPFCGSGTAVIAAEKTGRRCYAIELDPRYVQVIVTRWEEFTGKRARLVRARGARRSR